MTHLFLILGLVYGGNDTLPVNFNQAYVLLYNANHL